ncbi:MAG: transcriptional regulator [Leifsonia sp.]|nr:transcriptional regulator [Leifsonia sp.]|tara:strand:- start:1191 stop:2420 length:1230 start_codon:yes stop_codon:yes gene_type:complete
MKVPPGSQSSLREANRARVIESLTRHGRLTQVELAQLTGLSPATVSNIVKEMVAAHVVVTSTTIRTGRRAIEVKLARRIGLVAGLHFSSRHLRIAIADVGHTIVAENRVPLALDHRHDSEFDRAALLLGDMLETIDASVTDLLSIGLAVPAPLDSRTGRLSSPGLLRGWDGISLAETLSRRLEVPVFADSEGHLGALAEARFGAARDTRGAAYLRLGHTISAGLVIDGQVFSGVTGKAGQIGHLTIDENGPLCRCGSRGCLETLAGGPALVDLFRDDPGMQRVHDILVHAERGDAAARRAIADAGRHIGVAVASLSNLFDPEVIVVGGELAEAGELLLAPLRHAMDRSALRSSTGLPDVVAGELGERAELIGTIAFAVENTPLPVAAAAQPAPATTAAGPSDAGASATD